MKNVVKFLGIMFVVLGIFGLGKSAHAEEIGDSLLDINYLQQYVIKSNDGVIFDIDRAEQNHESTIILEVGQTFNQFAKLDDNTTEGKKEW